MDGERKKHASTEHLGEEKPSFSFKVLQTFQSELPRQVSEAVRLRRRGDGVLNCKGVYKRCALPRLGVEQNERIIGEEEPTPSPAAQSRRCTERRK